MGEGREREGWERGDDLIIKEMSIDITQTESFIDRNNHRKWRDPLTTNGRIYFLFKSSCFHNFI